MGHSFAVATLKPIVIHRSRFLTIRFGTSAPRQKQKSSSTIRFGSQIKKQKLEFTIRFRTSASNSNHFSTSAPKMKGRTVGVELSFWNRNGTAKLTSHYLFWNRCSKCFITPKRNSTIPLFNFPSKLKLGSPPTMKASEIPLQMSGRS